MSGGQVYGEPYAVLPESVIYSEVSTNAKVLYAIFALHADSEGRCYPGLKRLSGFMRCSEDTVKRAKKELAEAKLIECHDRYDDAGRRTTDDVVLRGAPRNAAPYVGGKDAPTELNPGRRTTPTESVGSSSSVGGGKNTPPARQGPPGPSGQCAHCKAPALIRVGGTWNPRTGEENPGTLLCGTCYDNASIAK